MPNFSSGMPKLAEGLDTLRITDRQWIEILDELDRRDARQSVKNCRRMSERVSYRKAGYLEAVITSPGGQSKQFRLRTRDLSDDGLGFLFGQFMYLGTRMTLILTHVDTGPLTVQATVRRCDHYERHIHRVGVQFDQPIDASAFILAAAA